MNRKHIIIITAALITALIPFFSWSLTRPSVPAQKASASVNAVTVNVSGCGELYWNYGKNMKFCLDGGWDSMNKACKVQNGESMSLSSIITRGLIPRAADGWYFDGFYNSGGKKITSIKQTPIDILHVKKNEHDYYDYFPTGESPKTYLKAVYGTSRYKTLDNAMLYTLPKTPMTFYAKFKEKSTRGFSAPSDYSLVYGDSGFFVWPDCPDEDSAVYRASSAKLLTIDKASGYAKIAGEGVATVTVTFPETEKLASESVKIKVRIRPPALSGVSAKLTTVKGKKYAAVYWTNDEKSSGCEIQVSDNADFKQIIAKKTVSSGKTSKTTIRLPKDAKAKYVRIRPLKRSCKEKLYGAYTVCRISA